MSMDKQKIIPRRSSDADNARRKLLKLGVYSVPTILFLGRVTGARASGQTIGEESKDRDCSILKKIISFGQWC
jgi:hypothetical protein